MSGAVATLEKPQPIEYAAPKRSARFSRHGWSARHLWAALVMVALGVLATLSAWRDIVYIALNDEESSQVWLVPFVAAWLVFVRRERFRRCAPVGSYIGPALALVGWGISTWGYRNAAQSLWHGGAVLVVVGALLSVIGRDVLQRFLPAFLVLVFLVPMPGRIRQTLAIPMQRGVAAVTEEFFEVAGADIERSGNELVINGNIVSVQEACNGMRMIFPVVLVSYAFAYGEPLRNYVRFLILIASPISAMLCNVLRTIPTVYLFGLDAARWKETAETFHDMAGWAMLVVAFLLLLGIKKVLEWALIPVAPYTLAAD